MSNPFMNIMENIQKAQKGLEEAQQEFNNLKITGSAGAGMVTVTSNGNGVILSIEIDDSVYQDGKKVLQDLLAAAFNDLKNKRDIVRNEKMQSLLVKFGLPNFNFPFMGG